MTKVRVTNFLVGQIDITSGEGRAVGNLHVGIVHQRLVSAPVAGSRIMDAVGQVSPLVAHHLPEGFPDGNPDQLVE